MTRAERRRKLLEKVAAGELAPNEGVVVLSALDQASIADEEQDIVLEGVLSGNIPPGDAARLLLASDGKRRVATTLVDEDINSVRVVGTFRTLRVNGDPSVRTAIAEGPHEVRSESGVMTFGEINDPDSPGFVLFGERPFQLKGRRISIGENSPEELRIRMNPELPLEIDLTAGTARVYDVKGKIRATLAAGSARFEGVQSPFSAVVDAGSLHVRGVFNRGDSEIRCTAGKVRIELEAGSSVKITARATLGKISLPDGRDWQGIGGGKREVTIGSGAGNLDIEATTGAAIVKSVGEPA